MASMRDKLKQANMANSVTRGNTSTNDTVFGDFANRADKKETPSLAMTNDTEKSLRTENGKNDEKVITGNSDRTENTVTVNNMDNDNNNKDVLNAVNNKNNDNALNNNIIKNNVNTANTFNNNNTINTLNTINNKSPEDIPEFTGRAVMIPLNITPEQDKYITRKAMSEGIPIRHVYKDIIVNEIMKSRHSIPDTPLSEEYRTMQRNKLRKTIQVESDLKEAIAAAARAYYMRPSAFASYAIEIAMREEKNI